MSIINNWTEWFVFLICSLLLLLLLLIYFFSFIHSSRTHTHTQRLVAHCVDCFFLSFDWLSFILPWLFLFSAKFAYARFSLLHKFSQCRIDMCLNEKRVLIFFFARMCVCVCAYSIIFLFRVLLRFCLSLWERNKKKVFVIVLVE